MRHAGLYLILLICTAFPSFSFGYSTDRGLIKINAEAAKGECLPPFDQNPMNVLRQNNIKVYTARNKPSVPGGSGCQSLSALSNKNPLSDPNDPRLKSLARVVSLLGSLGTGEMSAHKDTAVVFGTVRGPSRQCGDHVQLNPGNQNCLGLGTTIDNDPHGGTSNVALIAHEIGHKIANSNEQANFNEYKTKVKSRCSITTYALKGRPTRPRSEEFAEVLAAYVTNPGIFEGKGRACREAFDFMAELFGETPANGLTINMTCESRKSSSTRVTLPEGVPLFPNRAKLRFNELFYKQTPDPHIAFPAEYTNPAEAAPVQ